MSLFLLGVDADGCRIGRVSRQVQRAGGEFGELVGHGLAGRERQDQVADGEADQRVRDQGDVAVRAAPASGR